MDLLFRLQRQPPINCPTRSEIQGPVSVLGEKSAEPPPALTAKDSTAPYHWRRGRHNDPACPFETTTPRLPDRLVVMLFACLVCVAPTARAQAVVLASTLGNSDNGWLQLDFSSHWYSQPFQTTGTLYSITSVTLNMANHTGANAILRVYTNSSGHPGSDTGVIFTTPANSDSRVNTTFNFSSGPTLATNTPYWLVLYNTNNTSIRLTYSTATTGTGSGFVASAPLFNPSTGNVNGWYDQNPGKYLHYSISAIPEPSTYAAIFGVAALALAVYRRKNRPRSS